MKKSTRAWVRKAESDYQYARTTAPADERFPDQVCFLCQQAAEKYLKAVLEELGLTVPKVHELDKLLTLLAPHDLQLQGIRRGLVFLTKFAVAARYPGFDASSRQAKSALRWATHVREECRTILKIKPPGKKTP